MEQTKKPTTIVKELVPLLEFEKRDVLLTDEGKLRRIEDLKKALVAGNSEHNKVKIIFEDSVSIKQVETTIWGVTENHIILKRNSLIPIHAVHEIQFI